MFNALLSQSVTAASVAAHSIIQGMFHWTISQTIQNPHSVRNVGHWTIQNKTFKLWQLLRETFETSHKESISFLALRYWKCDCHINKTQNRFKKGNFRKDIKYRLERGMTTIVQVWNLFLPSYDLSKSVIADWATVIRSPTEAENFSAALCVQTDSGAHPASCTMGTGFFFPGGKARQGRDADRSPPSRAEIKKEWKLYFLLPQPPPWRVVRQL
jgi:hypothetical protein